MVILNVELWPKTTDEMQTFANNCVNNCVVYFNCLLLKRGVNVNFILSEWRIVKKSEVKNKTSRSCKVVLESHF